MIDSANDKQRIRKVLKLMGARSACRFHQRTDPIAGVHVKGALTLGKNIGV